MLAHSTRRFPNITTGGMSRVCRDFVILHVTYVLFIHVRNCLALILIVVFIINYVRFFIITVMKLEIICSFTQV